MEGAYDMKNMNTRQVADMVDAMMRTLGYEGQRVTLSGGGDILCLRDGDHVLMGTTDTFGDDAVVRLTREEVQSLMDALVNVLE